MEKKKTIIEEELGKLGWYFNEGARQWQRYRDGKMDATEENIPWAFDVADATVKTLMRMENNG